MRLHAVVTFACAVAGIHAIPASAQETSEASPEPEPEPEPEPVSSPLYQTSVVGPRSPATASAREVDAASLAATPRKDAGDLLTLVPGLWIARHGAEGKGQQWFLRGFDAVHGSDLEVRFAGVPVNELSNVHGQGYVDLGFVIPEVLLGLEARKGPFTLAQGNFGTAGSVELAPGVATEQRGLRAGAELGTYGRRRALVLWAPEDRPEHDFLAAELLDDEGVGRNRASRRASAMGQARVYDAPGASLTLLASVYTAGFGEPGVVPETLVDDGRMGRFDSPSPDTGGASRRGSLILHHAYARGAAAVDTRVWLVARALELEQNFTGFLLDAERGDRRAQEHRALGAGVRSDASWRLARGVELLLGASTWVEGFAQLEDLIDAAHVPWMRTRELSGVQVASAAYAGASWRLRPWWRLEGGARLDVFAFSVDDGHARDVVAQPSPRLVSVFSPRADLRLYVAYGRGVRAPEARAVTDVDAGSARATHSDAGELGVRWLAPHDVELAAAGFATHVSGELVFDHVAGTSVQVNATRRAGVELAASWQPRGWLALRGDVTAVDARFVDSGAPVPGAPTLLATGALTLSRADGWRAGAHATYLAPRPLAHGARAQAVGVVDLVGARRFRHFELGVEIDNLFDAAWRQGEYHFASWFDRAEARSAIPTTHFTPGDPLTVRATLSAWF